MTRFLRTAVVTGGVVYPAGTAETADLASRITNPAHWAGEASTATTAPPARITADYDEHTKADLQHEVDLRNADRDPAGEAYIVPDGKGNKPDLVKALTADDHR